MCVDVLVEAGCPKGEVVVVIVVVVFVVVVPVVVEYCCWKGPLGCLLYLWLALGPLGRCFGGPWGMGGPLGALGQAWGDLGGPWGVPGSHWVTIKKRNEAFEKHRWA